MIDNNKNFRVKEDADGPMGIKFKKGQEIQMIRGMVYMGGVPLQGDYQSAVITWVSNNKNLLTDIT